MSGGRWADSYGAPLRARVRRRELPLRVSPETRAAGEKPWWPRRGRLFWTMGIGKHSRLPVLGQFAVPFALRCGPLPKQTERRLTKDACRQQMSSAGARKQRRRLLPAEVPVLG